MHAKDLTKVSPASPNEMLGPYKVLARMIDKCRATIAGTNGEYKFNCPLDRRFMEWKGINADEFKAFVAVGHSDDEIVEWVNHHGIKKSQEEIQEWLKTVDPKDYATRPGKEWFLKDCEKLGLDPFKTSLFTYLEADDKASFPS